LREIHPYNLAGNQVAGVLELCRRPQKTQDPVICPLCHETFHFDDKFRKHLGGELEEFALFALPRGQEIEYDSDSSSDGAPSLGSAPRADSLHTISPDATQSLEDTHDPAYGASIPNQSPDDDQNLNQNYYSNSRSDMTPTPDDRPVTDSIPSTIHMFPRPPSWNGNENLRQDSPLREESLTYRQTGFPPSRDMFRAEQDVNLQTRSQSPATSPMKLSFASRSPISRCRLAGNHISALYQGLGPCQGCEASKAHFLALNAKLLTREALIDQLVDVQNHLEDKDIFGNTPLHFLADSGPTDRHHIPRFITHSTGLFHSNCDNENFLHVLDPSNLGSELPLLLQWVYVSLGGVLLRQRTYDGKTVLHCLIARNISVKLLTAILPIFQSAKSNIDARDNHGQTAIELFYQKWILVTRTHEEWNELQGVLDVYAPNLKVVRRPENEISFFTFPPGSSPSDVSAILSGQSPSRHRSGDLSTAAQEQKLSEMRTTMLNSRLNPHVTDYCGRNGLHCLFHTICTTPEPDISWKAHEQDLMEMLSSGVEILNYDRFGSTPLHSILATTTTDRQHDKFRAFLIGKIIPRAPGVANMRNKEGNTALHLACGAGLVACVEMLLAHRSDIDALNYAGRSVISQAKLMRITGEQNVQIGQCIMLVERANGFEFPYRLEDLLSHA
jgi:ankyrin repeat protein